MRKIVLAAMLVLAVGCNGNRGLLEVSPESVGMNSEKLTLADSAINDAIDQGIIPGAVLSVVRHGKIAYLKAYGNKSVVPDTVPMTTETLFDLASLSKCVGTATSVMQLVENGKIRLEDSVAMYIPGFKPWVDPVTGKKDRITVMDLLTHSSGLDSYINVPSYVAEYGENTPDSLLRYIATRVNRNFKPGTDMIYSCLNFITLQGILEKVTGERLCDYAQKNVFDVLGMNHTTYFPLYGREQSNPRSAELAKLCAPTEVQPDGKPLVAAVHDPIARLINAGNSGNAGVFTDARDLSLYAAAIMNGGEINGRRVLGKETVRRMVTVPIENDPSVGRALGWDTYLVGGVTSGEIFSMDHTVGHTGYTGTSLIMDLDDDTAVVLLTNRVHPADNTSVGRLRCVVANIVAGSIEN
jgi:CubicO group peptidase (beta-lactamase class C family)